MFAHLVSRGKRSGVALVIVLALLALLMILSASFLFTMRIERAGSANNRHDYVAGQVAHAGLDYAISAIDHFLIQNKDESRWNDGAGSYWEYDSGNRVFTLHADTFVSLREDLSENEARNKAARANGFVPLGSKAADFLPPALAYRGSASKLILDQDGRSQVSIDSPEWIPVRPYGTLDKGSVGNVDDSETKKSNPVIGRYAFMAFDTTGLIDVNHVMTNAHVWGKEPGEIQLDHKAFAADFRDPGNAEILRPENVTGFMDIRDGDGSYVSFRDMTALNDYFDPAYSRHLKLLSYEPPWPAWTNADAVVEIGGDAEKLKGRIQEIEDAFYESGLTEDQAYYAARGLIDYVDEDSSPYGKTEEERFARPVTERMPLMAGGMARIRIKRWAKPVLNADGSDGEESSHQCVYQMSIDGVVPFTWMYDEFGTRDGDDAYEVEGKVAVKAIKGKNELCSKLLPSGARGKEHRQRFDIDDASLVYVDFGTGAEVEGEVESMEDLSLDLKMKISFAGATYKGGEVLHRYPILAPDYRTFDPDYWLTVDFNGLKPGYANPHSKSSEGIQFREVKKVKKLSPKNSEGKSFNVMCSAWEAEYVVWVDILDPRYGYRDMAEGGGSVQDLLRGFYRPSHASPDQVAHDGVKPILKLAEDGDFDRLELDNGENVFDLAEHQSKKEFGAKDRDGLVDLAMNYFHPVGFVGTGCSSFSNYILQNPKLVQDFLNIHVDGVRLGTERGRTDEEGAYWRTYVKNKPIESAGELGALPIGQWLTIRLYDYNEAGVGDPRKLKNDSPDNRIPGLDGYEPDYPGYHTVLDHFAVDKRWERPGRVSIDSAEPAVLGAPFCGLPVATVGKNTYRVSGADSEQLAQVLAKLRLDGELNRCSDFGKMFRPLGLKYTGKSSEGNEETFETGSEIACPRQLKDNVSLPSMVAFQTLDKARGTYVGEFEREALIAKAYNLFTNRGRTFLIVVKAQAYTPSFFHSAIRDETGAIHASRTLIAEVWRDTIDENKDGAYPWKIVSVIMLDE